MNILHTLGDVFSESIGYAAVRDWRPSARSDEVILDIPIYAQIDSYSCGAVSGFQVANYFDESLSFEDFYSVARPTRSNGTSRSRLKKALNTFGVSCRNISHPCMMDVRRSIDGGKPLLLVICNPSAENAHWVACYGYGENHVRIATNGLPWFSPHRVPTEQFLEIWKAGSMEDTLVCSKNPRSADTRYLQTRPCVSR